MTSSRSAPARPRRRAWSSTRPPRAGGRYATCRWTWTASTSRRPPPGSSGLSGPLRARGGRRFRAGSRPRAGAIGRRLAMFLGSTIGNLDTPAQRRRLLADLRALLPDSGDRLLLGVDLVKDVKVLRGGVRRLGRRHPRLQPQYLAGGQPRGGRRLRSGGLPPPRVLQREGFAHRDAPGRRSAQTVRLGRLGLTVRFRPGEGIWTESSYKFTRAGVEALLGDASLRPRPWHVDPANLFVLR